jgi:CheY-like chemotaxis protein
MRDMDGYMLLQQIRDRSPNQGGMIPAIALTAYAAQRSNIEHFRSDFKLISQNLWSVRVLESDLTFARTRLQQNRTFTPLSQMLR